MTTPAGARVVSVVIPTFHRPKLLQRCLQRLLQQTLPVRQFEIIVVDDGADEVTQRLVESLGARLAVRDEASPRVVYVRPVGGRGPAIARNTGWRVAQGEIVAFTDDDTLPEPDWLERGVEQLRLHPDWAALGGQVRVPLDPPPGRRPTDHELMTQGLERAEFVTANAFVRRAALAAIQGFDERYTRAWREDSDLQFRLMGQVGPVGRANEPVVLHPARAERWGVCLRQQRNAYFEALLYRSHPRLYRERIARGPPWIYYAIVGCTLVLLPAAAIGAWRVAQGAATGALLAMLGVAARRLRHTSLAPAHVLEMVATSALIPFLSVYWRLRGALRFKVAFF